MRYFLADIAEHNGEFVHHTTIRFQVEDNIDPRGAHLEIVASWYSGMVEDKDGYWWSRGVVAVSDDKLTEIDKATFDGVENHIIKLFA